jgi:hypothetical protein
VHATLWSRLSGVAHDVIDGIASWVSSFSAIDFVLAAAILWAAYWIWSTLRAATRLGPVEVATLDHDEAQAPDVNALTGLLRERLATAGLLPPPEVPAGSPQTDLIAAVEASGHPQAPLVARALELVPHPPRSPEYKLNGTILGGNGNGSTAGLRYWLQPKHTGRSLLQTVTETSSEEAVRRAASHIFLEISRDAVHVFPQWAQWSRWEAVREYVDGIEDRVAEQDEDAVTHFNEACSSQPANLLPQLQLANLREKRAGMKQAAAVDPWARPKEQAKALRSYLDIGVARADVVAARYRASVLAGMLATTCELEPGEELTPGRAQALEEIRDIIGLRSDDGSVVSPGEVGRALHDLAAAEAKNAYELVGRFHVLFDKHRLRHRYEPTGLERRRLRRTIAISRHTLRIRRLGNDASAPARREVRLHKAIVRWIHLGLFRGSAGWNAHYNAGCFYALLYNRELSILAQADEQSEAVDA